MSVKWGVVSTADINRKFLAGAREADDTELLAVASRDQDRAGAYARENGIERAYGSYEALFADADVEAVYISLPNSMHVGWTVRALEAGKHVLCEKPLSRRTTEVEHAFDVAERNERLLMEGFMYRHNPQTRRLTELVSAGAVGRVRMIRGVFGFVAHDPANVRLSAKLEGGALMDVGCYCVSGSRSSAQTPTVSRPRTCPPRSAAARRSCSIGPTRSGRPARSERCTSRPTKAARSAYAHEMAPRASTALGEIIRHQRELAEMSMRQFADLAGISNPYLSQIERGLRAPSQQVVDGIAKALKLSADALYEQAGMRPPGEEPEDNAVLDAIAADHRLTARQRKALIEIYESLIACVPAHAKRSSS